MLPPPRHPTYRSLNAPLTIWGVDRRFFFGALMVGAVAFNFFGSVLAGLLLFAVLYGIARWIAVTDPQWPRILLASARLHTHYDPAKIVHKATSLGDFDDYDGRNPSSVSPGGTAPRADSHSALGG